MPSLLDLYAQRNPSLGGLLQQPQTPQTPEPMPPAGGAGGLFAGAQLPRPGGPQGGLMGRGGPPQPQQQQQQAAQQQAAQEQQSNLMRALRIQSERAAAPDQKLDGRETLINTGLALLSSGPGRNVSYGQALAAGLMAGRQAAAQNNQARQMEAAAQQRSQQYLSVLGEGELNRSKIDDAIKIAVIRGDEDALGVFRDLRKQLGDEAKVLERTKVDLPNGSFGFADKLGRLFSVDGNQMSDQDIQDLPPAPVEAKWELRTLGEGAGAAMVRVDTNSGVAYEVGSNRLMDPQEIRQAIASRNPRAPILRTYVREDGTELEAMYDERGRKIPGTEMIVGRPEAGKAKGDNARVQLIQQDVDAMRDIFDEFGYDSFEGFMGKFSGPVDRVAQAFDINTAMEEPLQKFNIHANNVLSLILQERSGATVSDAEYQRLAAVLRPQPGDAEATVRAKIQQVERIMEGYRDQGSDAVTQNLFNENGEYIGADSWELLQRQLDQNLGGGEASDGRANAVARLNALQGSN